MGIKVTRPTPSTLTIQLCGEHVEAIMNMCGKVSGHSTMPSNTKVVLAKIDSKGLSDIDSINFRQIMAALWEIKWADIKAKSDTKHPF